MSDIAALSPTSRSRSTNQRLRGRLTTRALFVEGDGRTPWARRYRDIVLLLAEDAGGVATLSEMKLALIRRAAALCVEAERMECDLAKGKRVDTDKLARLSGHVRRIAIELGIEKVRRDEAPPTLAELAAKHRKGGA